MLKGDKAEVTGGRMTGKQNFGELCYHGEYLTISNNASSSSLILLSS